MKVAISEVRIGRRHRKDLGDLSGLTRSLAAVGLLHPIVINEDKKLIAGGRRLAAAKLLGWTEIPSTIVRTLTEALPLLIAERDENTERKALTGEEAVSLADAIEPKLEAEAKERVKAGGGSGPSGRKTFHTRDKGKARDKVAAAVGLSAPTLKKARELVRAAEEHPEFRPLVDEMNRSGRVSGVHRKLVTARAVERLRDEPPLTQNDEGPFRVIVVDPPWQYDARAEDASHRSANPYPSMPIGEIRALDLGAVAHKDSVLWLWTTNAHLPEAFGVLAAWGFAYKTTLTWVKDRIGTGDWLRGKTEHCLMAIRGKPVVTLKGQSTVVMGPMRQHSRKPDEFYALVESLCPGNRVDLFGRQQREGWVVRGVESGKFQAAR